MRTTAVSRAALVALGFLPFVGLELALRAFGLPSGFFDFVRVGPNGLYAPDAEFVVPVGPIPYRVRTNALGLRGAEIAPQKPAGTFRIAAVGDSVTDGFYVDDEDTFPHQLERALRDRGPRVEVLNAARGGASIDRELAVLRDVAQPLDPDLVILTFVTNDLSGLRGTSERDALARRARPDLAERLEGWLLARTALGEAVGRLRLAALAAAGEGGARPRVEAETLSPARYRIEGARDHRRNANLFLWRYRASDGLALREPWSEEARELFDRYVALLARFAALCREAEAPLVFVYFPAYSQVYVPDAPLHVRDRLRREVERLGARFLDLTPVFRQRGREEVLHLAPLDFHPSPRGNRVMAEAVAAFLRDQHLVP